MAEAGKFRFTIDRYTPETLPMARLAEYLSQLATLFGEKQAVHFTTSEAEGAVPLIRVEADALPQVRDRLSAIGRGEGPMDAMRAYRSINERLRLDDTSATLTGRRRPPSFGEGRCRGTSARPSNQRHRDGVLWFRMTWIAFFGIVFSRRMRAHDELAVRFQK